MSKKLFFILLPIIAIFFIYSNTGNAFPHSTEHGVSMGNAVAAHNPSLYTFDLSKNNNHHNKNKIRIKAWDDSTPLAVAPLATIPINKVFYSDRLIFFEHGTDVTSTCSSSRFLRGPPAVI